MYKTSSPCLGDKVLVIYERKFVRYGPNPDTACILSVAGTETGEIEKAWTATRRERTAYRTPSNIGRYGS